MPGNPEQLSASMKSVIALYRNLGPVVTEGRLRQLRDIIQRERQWTTDAVHPFGELQPEASSYALMLGEIAKQFDRLDDLVPGLGLGTATPGQHDLASQVEAAVGGIETLARSLEGRLLSGWPHEPTAGLLE